MAVITVNTDQLSEVGEILKAVLVDEKLVLVRKWAGASAHLAHLNHIMPSDFQSIPPQRGLNCIGLVPMPDKPQTNTGGCRQVFALPGGVQSSILKRSRGGIDVPFIDQFAVTRPGNIIPFSGKLTIIKPREKPAIRLCITRSILIATIESGSIFTLEPGALAQHPAASYRVASRRALVTCSAGMPDSRQRS